MLLLGSCQRTCIRHLDQLNFPINNENLNWIAYYEYFIIISWSFLNSSQSTFRRHHTISLQNYSSYSYYDHHLTQLCFSDCFVIEETSLFSLHLLVLVDYFRSRCLYMNQVFMELDETLVQVMVLMSSRTWLLSLHGSNHYLDHLYQFEEYLMYFNLVIQGPVPLNFSISNAYLSFY